VGVPFEKRDAVMHNQHLHDLTDELKRLAGWGAKPHLLAVRPVLVMLAGAEGARFVQQGGIVLDYLKESIAAMERPITFMDQVVKPEVARRCFLLLLKIEGTRMMGHEERRATVIRLLKVYCSVETWKRPVGPEREFLGILARHMIERHQANAA
jgi:hypothetical protein